MKQLWFEAGLLMHWREHLATSVRKSSPAQIAHSELGNPNCEAPSYILWGRHVSCFPISKTFPISILEVCSSRDDAESWHMLGQWQPGLRAELAESPQLWLMRAEALSWDNKMLVRLGNVYFPHTWALFSVTAVQIPSSSFGIGVHVCARVCEILVLHQCERY